MHEWILWSSFVYHSSRNSVGSANPQIDWLRCRIHWVEIRINFGLIGTRLMNLLFPPEEKKTLNCAGSLVSFALIEHRERCQFSTWQKSLEHSNFVHNAAFPHLSSGRPHTSLLGCSRFFQLVSETFYQNYLDSFGSECHNEKKKNFCFIPYKCVVV